MHIFKIYRSFLAKLKAINVKWKSTNCSTDLMALPSEFTLYISKKRHGKFYLNVTNMQGIFDASLSD